MVDQSKVTTPSSDFNRYEDKQARMDEGISKGDGSYKSSGVKPQREHKDG